MQIYVGKEIFCNKSKKNTTKYEHKSERENEPVELIIKKI